LFLPSLPPNTFASEVKHTYFSVSFHVYLATAVSVFAHSSSVISDISTSVPLTMNHFQLNFALVEYAGSFFSS